MIGLRLIGLAAALVVALVSIAACDYSRVDVATQSGTAACEDVPGVISARTFACGAGHDKSNARFDAFNDGYRCVSWDPTVVPYEELWHCAFIIGQLDCSIVDRFGDNLDEWLSVSPACPLIIERADGTALPGGIVRGEGE